MGGAAGPGGAVPRGDARLQRRHLLSWTAQADLDDLAVHDPDAADEADQAADRLTRRWNDLQTVNDLALRNFAGRDYELFTGALAAYGYPVVRSWLRRGLMFEFCSQRGRPAKPSPREREFLSDPDSAGEAAEERKELALETNARALVAFREQVLITGAWSFEGGASLKTYYVGACLLAFPNVFSVWLTERRHRNFKDVEASDLGPALENVTGWDALDSTLDRDPATAVVGNLAVAAELAAMPDKTREAAGRLILTGAAYAEIAAELGVTERAVEAMFYRYRRTASQRQLVRRIK